MEAIAKLHGQLQHSNIELERVQARIVELEKKIKQENDIARQEEHELLEISRAVNENRQIYQRESNKYDELKMKTVSMELKRDSLVCKCDFIPNTLLTLADEFLKSSRSGMETISEWPEISKKMDSHVTIVEKELEQLKIRVMNNRSTLKIKRNEEEKAIEDEIIEEEKSLSKINSAVEGLKKINEEMKKKGGENTFVSQSHRKHVDHDEQTSKVVSVIEAPRIAPQFSNGNGGKYQYDIPQYQHSTTTPPPVITYITRTITEEMSQTHVQDGRDLFSVSDPVENASEKKPWFHMLRKRSSDSMYQERHENTRKRGFRNGLELMHDNTDIYNID